MVSSNLDWYRRVVDCAKKAITGTIWYCFSTGGKLYILCCYPRMPEDSPALAPEKQRIMGCFQNLHTALTAGNPEGEKTPLRIILSDMQSGTNAVFRCFNSLHHSMEYLDFRRMEAGVIQMDAEQQLHDAFIEDMSAYRLFAVSVADRLIRDDCEPAALAGEIAERILANAAPSMESVHHHLQIFILTFTEYLESAGTVDSAYIKRHGIVYRVMAFEDQREMGARLAEILSELYEQGRKLRLMGRQERIQSVRNYVEEHIAESELTIASISERFGIGEAQLARQFSRYYGVSLYKYMQQCRYRLAGKLIRENPTTPLAHIALQSGYSDVSTMYRAFRQLGNTTPGALKLSKPETDA